MTTHFIEKDFINQIREKNNQNSYKEWEMASPRVFECIYRNQKNLQWKPIEFDGIQYQYTFVQCPTVFGMARVYLFCRNEHMFDMEFYQTDSDENTLYQWWKVWANRPLLITAPILYHTSKGQLYSWTIYSQRRYYQSIEKKESDIWFLEDERTILHYFIDAKCFVIASGLIYILGLYRTQSILQESILLSVLQKWKEEYLFDYSLWSIQFETDSIESSILIYSGLNASIGDQPLLYLLYGKVSLPLLTFFMKHTEHIEPICEIATQMHTNHTMIYYVSFYSKLFQSIEDSMWDWVDPFLDKMSMHSLTSILEPDAFKLHIPFYKIILNLFHYHRSDVKKKYLDYYLKEMNIPLEMFKKTLFATSFQMYNQVYFRTLRSSIVEFWDFLQQNYFHSDTSWTEEFNQCLLENYYNIQLSVPPWQFFHWAFHTDRYYKLLPFHSSSLVYIRPHKKHMKLNRHHQDIYTTMQMFPPSTIPYLFQKHILQKRIQTILYSIYSIRKNIHPSIGDSIADYFLSNKNRFFRTTT